MARSKTRKIAPHCQWCGNSLENRRRNAKFCGNSCRAHFWRFFKTLPLLEHRALTTIEQMANMATLEGMDERAFEHITVVRNYCQRLLDQGAQGRLL